MKFQANLLCIEGSHTGSPNFIAALRKKDYLVQSVTTGKAALQNLKKEKPHVVIVNAASLRTSGIRIVQSLRAQNKRLPIILICEEGINLPPDVPANTILQLPFTIRKLDNRIKPLLPILSDHVLKTGVIQLDKERLMLRCQGKETRLTPRMARLLELLMQKPGEVIERDHLFRQVWETDFTDDTRTLDVHISWLRRAIEADPRKPKYLKTLRGVGYRLDV